MRRTRPFLLLCSFLMSLLATCTVLSVALGPKGGLGPQLQKQLAAWMPKENVPLARPVTTETPQALTYHLQANYDFQHKVIHGQETVQLPSQSLDEIPFYLYASKEYPIQVQDVKLNGKNISYSLTDKELILHAKKTTSTETVTFSFTTRVPESKSRFGDWQGVSTVSYWYPILAVQQGGHWLPRPDSEGFGDPYQMDLADYEVDWTSPVDFKWYTSGVQTKSAPVGKNNVVYHFSGEKLRNFALVGGAHFQQTEFQIGTGTRVIVAAEKPNGNSDENPDVLQKTAALARSAVETYTQKIGADPYPALTVIETPPGTTYALELPNIALFSHDLWSEPDTEHWIAHEIAHTWFYNTVGNYEAQTPWLDEGLADYSSLLETEQRAGEGAYNKAIADDWNRFVHGYTYSPFPYGTPISVLNGKTAVPYGTYHDDETLYYYSYLRPILMYHDLRKQLGDEKFFQFLRQYYVKNEQRTVGRDDLVQALQDVAPQAVPLLNMWLDTPNDQLIERVKGDF